MASSCTITLEFRQIQNRETCVLKFAWTAHTDGSFTSVSTDDTDITPHQTVTDIIKGWNVAYGVTNPGATAPTADYDITITDSDSEDIFGGALGNRSATATESAFPEVGGDSSVRTIHSALTLAISNNSVNGAAGVVKLYLQKSPSASGYVNTRQLQFNVIGAQTIAGVVSTATGKTVTINWGDGSSTESFTGTDQAYSHVYSGDAVFKVFGGSSALTKFTQTNTSVALGGKLTLGRGITSCLIYGNSNSFTGALSFPSVMTYCYIRGNSNSFTGSLSLPSVMTSCVIYGDSNAFSSYSTGSLANNQNIFYLVTTNSGGFSSTDVDNILIDYSNAGGTWTGSKAITITGSGCPSRTGASDAAVTDLESKGVTVTTP